MATLCGECGRRAVVPRAVAGRRSLYRNFPSLPIPADLAIPTCANCGAEWVDGKTAARLDTALAEAASMTLAAIGKESIEALGEALTQRELEADLGLSSGYLSKVKHGKETPSAALAALLSLLAARPGRLEEVRRVWKAGRLPVGCIR